MSTLKYIAGNIEELIIYIENFVNQDISNMQRRIEIAIWDGRMVVGSLVDKFDVQVKRVANSEIELSYCVEELIEEEKYFGIYFNFEQNPLLKINWLIKTRVVPASNFVGTISANVDNGKMSDKQFREFIQNTLPIVMYDGCDRN